ncbi:VanZ family protein [Streptomyces sp. NPDC058620]|uniref:VanZ family protein n=1 Tax=Streptomyces sp. NPDC058620 TaxID=3346560 RepID=UPI0036522D51
MLLRASMLVATIVGLVAFSVVLAHVTLTPSPASEDLVTSNLRPGRSLRQYAEDYTFLAACKQAGGNLLLGAPFGVLLPILVARRLRMIRMILLTAAVMVIVELVQGALVAGRAFDIDDVILNTTGALLGYLLVGRRISHRYHALGDTSPAAAPDDAEPAASKAGTRRVAKAGTQAGTKTRTKPRIKPRAKAPEGRSASAPARVRELVTRIRNRGPGKGEGAPRPGRRRGQSAG